MSLHPVIDWLRECGLEEERRVARETDAVIHVSKLGARETRALFASIDAVPELFDAAAVGAEYERLAAVRRAAGDDPPRSEVWRAASESLLRRLAAERGAGRGLPFVMPGLDSVRAVVDTLLWRLPTVGEAYEPAPGEEAAYADLMSAEPERDIFTRRYGCFDGKAVENYCPGAPFARRLVEQAYRVCAANGAPLKPGVRRVGSAPRRGDSQGSLAR
jgi:hypothetical protein